MGIYKHTKRDIMYILNQIYKQYTFLKFCQEEILDWFEPEKSLIKLWQAFNSISLSLKKKSLLKS